MLNTLAGVVIQVVTELDVQPFPEEGSRKA